MGKPKKSRKAKTLNPAVRLRHAVGSNARGTSAAILGVFLGALVIFSSNLLKRSNLLFFAAPPSDKTTDQCGLYMAESSIPNSGLGVYSGFGVEEGDEIGFPDICIQLIDNRFDTHFDDYRWKSYSTGGLFEADLAQSLCPGFGMLANSYQKNAAMQLPAMDDGGLHRSRHPGAGAITSFHNCSNLAVKNIAAGSEIFLSYGTTWFEQREGQLGKLPQPSDYEAADKVVRNLATFATKHGRKLSSRAKEDAIALIRSSLSGVDEGLSMVRGLLPKQLDEAVSVAEFGTALSALPNSKRTISWLEENGLCMDNIRPGMSTNVEAGRGAFATRRIPEGGLVAPLPLVHLPSERVLEYQRNGETLKQLMLNYCFGHPKSKLLLFPYSSVVNLINHDSKEPNARIQWSGSEHHRAEWMEQNPDVWMHRKPSLILELIAIKTIQPGQEVFIDYGRDWEEAWDDHVRGWKPSPGADKYSPASALNDVSVPVKTMNEQTTSPYPNNVETACYYNYEPMEAQLKKQPRPARSIDIEWNEFENTFEFQWFLCRCEVLKRDEALSGESLYTAQFSDVQPSSCQTIPRALRYIQKIPRRAIVLVDRPYTSNQHLESAFRHPIGIPDAIFPEAWMNSV